MPAPAETQARFCAALLAPGQPPAPPPGLVAPGADAAEVARRFAVYRNNVHHGLSRALAARFPVVEQLVGAAFFAALARAFLVAHPPRTPVLLAWGDALPEFLEGFAPVASLPWLADVARLELARGVAFHAADAEAVGPAALGAADPAVLRLRLHPSVRLVASAWPVVSIWQAHQPGGPPGAVTPGAERALVARDPGGAVIVAPLDAPGHAVLDALGRGVPLGRAAAAGDPTDALALLLRHGLITDVSTGEDP